jgi:hypothetical protein
VYEQLYRRIYSWLKPGGCFVCYDHVLGDSPALTALNALGWHRLLRAAQTPERAQEGIVGTYQEDSPLPLRQHLNMLVAAGFSVADVLYKRDTSPFTWPSNRGAGTQAGSAAGRGAVARCSITRAMPSGPMILNRLPGAK